MAFMTTNKQQTSHNDRSSVVVVIIIIYSLFNDAFSVSQGRSSVTCTKLKRDLGCECILLIS
jgi:hypothetical protein